MTYQVYQLLTLFSIVLGIYLPYLLPYFNDRVTTTTAQHDRHQHRSDDSSRFVYHLGNVAKCLPLPDCSDPE